MVFFDHEAFAYPQHARGAGAREILVVGRHD
jgi:hypothetical protein